jgi:predicted secreted protein
MRYAISIGIILAWALPALANPEVDARNRVSFQVEAMREVANDWATAHLSVVAEGKEPAAIATTVNRRMAKAVATAKGTKDTEVESGAYVTQPIYDDGRVVRWRASQVLRLESADVERLAQLIGVLQSEDVLLSSIDFSVQPKTRATVEEALIEEALGAFRTRAGLITKGMGEKNWSLISLSVGQSGGHPRMLQMRAESNMMSMSKSTSPALEAGTSELRVQASGTVELD